MTTRALKNPKSFDQQVQILVDRKLNISDRNKVKEILRKINYYRLSAYFKPFYKPSIEEFQEGVTFEDVYNLYNFDKELRELLLRLTAMIEVAFRTTVAYYIAHNYGIEGHLDSNIFFDRSKHPDFVTKVNQEFLKSKDTFISHHNSI